MLPFRVRSLRLIAAVVIGLSLVGLAGRSGGSVAKASGGSGLETVLRPIGPGGTTVSGSALSRSVEIMRDRLARLGGGGSVTRQAGSNLIVVRLNHVSLSRGAAEIVDKTAQLELYDLTPSLLPPSVDASENPVYETSLFDLLSRVQHSGTKGAPGPYYLFRTKGKKQLKGPAATRGLLLKSTAGRVPMGDVVLAVPPKAVVITCDATVSTDCPYSTTGIQPQPGVTYYYLFKHGSYPGDDENPYPQMTGNDLKLTGTQQDFDPTTGQPIVTLQFTGHGDKQFLAITKAEAQRGAALGIRQSFAIVLDDQLYSFPTIDYQQNPTGIDPTAGGAEITGMASLSEAKHVALVLQSGSLPVKFVVVSRRSLG